ncbi:hypothetical protein CK203_106323 [Vitis vinifera]|uniref:DUF4218 domain-containing protein n=1 Tax=Vitis vinifera TaxID=29760 RepID=A0A438CDT6_VITVI|nr:hypothetical protein CK203_106323 [Vitis vinifera]
MVHLVKEVRLGGPVYLKWIYPFERFMKVLKGYVEVAIGNEEPISKILKWIAYGPSHYVFKYHGYVINGCHYHTKERDDLRVTQNSGVSIVATTMQIASAKDKNPVFDELDPRWSVVLSIPQQDFLEMDEGDDVMDNSIEHHLTISSLPQVESFDAMDDSDAIFMRGVCEGIWVENKSYM